MRLLDCLFRAVDGSVESKECCLFRKPRWRLDPLDPRSYLISIAPARLTTLLHPWSTTVY